ncbi:MAG: sortase, partial [Acutalibacteraceae bacterium]|nr:sortase [Acutalibacteraceae bacterium]
LKVGDEIYITNFWETLVYKVAETKVIIPNDSQNIYIQPGRNLLTLTTCHPYPEKYQRYLVFAEFAGTEK